MRNFLQRASARAREAHAEDPGFSTPTHGLFSCVALRARAARVGDPGCALG